VADDGDLDLGYVQLCKEPHVIGGILAAITDTGRVHINANAVYYIKLVSDLSWNFSFYGSWDTRPPVVLVFRETPEDGND
jgi:hypothetical protein